MGEIIGNETASKLPSGQIYTMTHKGDNTRVPFMYRSFISFSFGGKVIEDFNLIAVTDGDRISRNAYAQFEDVTDKYETFDGQIYWGSHHTDNTIQFKLVTDGITERQLNEFKHWFKPGVARELILAEHPNRAIMARIETPPVINILPFEYDTKTMIAGQSFDTKVSIYKGEIDLSFVMDEPYWYAKHNIILPYLVGSHANGVIDVQADINYIVNLIKTNYIGYKFYITWHNFGKTTLYNSYATISEVGIGGIDKAYWYIKLENITPQDHIPTDSILWYPDNIDALWIGTNTIGSAEFPKEEMLDDKYDFLKIINEDNIPHYMMIKDPVLLGENMAVKELDDESRIFNNTSEIVNNLEPYHGAHIQFYGYIGNNIMSWPDSINIDIQHPVYLFYSGTAPSKPILQFTFTPTFNNNKYVNLPKNSYTNPEEIKNGEYNYIQVKDQIFKFTTPRLITGYNQALYIIDNLSNETAIIELLNQLKENINEYYARAWAIKCVEKVKGNEILINNTFRNNFKTELQKLIADENTGEVQSVTCKFDSKTGEAIAFYHIHNLEGNGYIDIEENVGDMVKSNYLIIDGRCYPNSKGWIQKWVCHSVTTDFPAAQPLKNLTINFKNMYY